MQVSNYLQFNKVILLTGIVKYKGVGKVFKKLFLKTNTTLSTFIIKFIILFISNVTLTVISNNYVFLWKHLYLYYPINFYFI